MYAGESAAAVETIEPAATLIQPWCAAAAGRVGLPAETPAAISRAAHGEGYSGARLRRGNSRDPGARRQGGAQAMSVHLVTPATAEFINPEPFKPLTIRMLEDGSHTWRPGRHNQARHD